MLNDDAPADAGQADTQATQTQTTDAKPWYDGADEDTVGFVQNKKWDSPLRVIQDYRNLEKFHGVPADQIIKLPKEDSPEAWDAIYNKLGRPEAPDKYGNDGLKLPEGVQIDPEMMTKFDSIVHKAGLTKAQRDMVYSEYFGIEAGRAEQIQNEILQQKEIQTNDLKKEWGDKFGERVELAKRAFRSVLPDGVDKEAVAEAFESNLGVAITAKLFANIADKFSEDTFGSNSNGDTRFGYSKEQAINDRNTLMSELRADPSRLANYNKGLGPDYDKMMRLNKLMNS